MEFLGKIDGFDYRVKVKVVAYVTITGTEQTSNEEIEEVAKTLVETGAIELEEIDEMEILKIEDDNLSS